MRGGERPIGVLGVGAGFLGTLRAAAVGKTPSAKLAAVCDVDANRGAAVVRRFGGRVETSFRDALEAADIDAVIVATPHADHFVQASTALEAGKHVLVEKPLAVDPVDAQRLALLADERRLRLATGLNHRGFPPIADVLAFVRGGAVGRVESVRAEIGHRADAAFLSSWHTDFDRSGGGTLMDNGPHACDLIDALLGGAVAAQGAVRRGGGAPAACEIEAVGAFRGADQSIAVLRSSWGQPTGYLTIEVRGSLGWLLAETAPRRLTGVLSNGRPLRRRYLAERVADRVHKLRFGCDLTIARETAAFVASAKGSRSGSSATWADGWDGCRAVELVDAVYRAADARTEVEIDPPVRDWPAADRRRASARRGD
jgi:predicted dehydrogenase